MDYKYIEQLLDSYWKGQTSLEEEKILKAFFSQKDIPAKLKMYQPLFVYAQKEVFQDGLGEDFDQKLLSIIGEEAPVKARTITMTQRLMPLFKAAAVVAIILTLSNAMQMSFNSSNNDLNNIDATEQVQQGRSVAIGDSATQDSMAQSSIVPSESLPKTIIK